MADWKKIFAPLERIFDKLWKFAGKSVSILVSFTFMIFALGSIFGYIIAGQVNLRQEIALILLIPPILGLIAYYYRTFAIICFIAFLLIILI